MNRITYKAISPRFAISIEVKGELSTVDVLLDRTETLRLVRPWHIQLRDRARQAIDMINAHADFNARCEADAMDNTYVVKYKRWS